MEEDKSTYLIQYPGLVFPNPMRSVEPPRSRQWHLSRFVFVCGREWMCSRKNRGQDCFEQMDSKGKRVEFVLAGKDPLLAHDVAMQR